MHQLLFPVSRLKRFKESYKHPDQAAIIARMPIIGERVPMRAFWRRRSVKPTRMARHAAGMARHEITHAGRAGAATTADAALIGAEYAGGVLRTGATEAARRAALVGRAGLRKGNETAHAGVARVASAFRDRAEHIEGESSERGPSKTRALAGACARSRVTLFLGALGLGAVAMYFSDRANGRRRRALVRDRVTHLRKVVTRDLPRRAERKGRFAGGVARGIQHGAAGLLDRHHMAVDDETLVARVRSEALRDRDIHSGEISIDAYEGCVTLRGQLDRREEIDELADRTRRVEGVTEVRNYLHLPGTPPPNKAPAYAAAGIPDHLSDNGA